MLEFNPQKRVTDLRTEIRRHDRLYYVEATPEISDRQYDLLLESLRKLEADFPDLATSDSPTRRVGDAPVEHLESVSHRVPMLSIDNTYSIDELESYLKRTEKQLEGFVADPKSVEWVMEYKIDGVAASLIYERGELVQGVTRGDGLTGDDITHNIRTVGGVPLRLIGSSVPDFLEIRGEVYMTNRDLEELNVRQASSDLPTYKNTRNVTAGTVRLLDPRVAAERRLRFFCHGVGHAEGLDAETHLQFLEFVTSLGLPPTPQVRLLRGSVSVMQAVRNLDQELPLLDFEVDGIVFKINRFDHRRHLGSTSKSPRWLIAYKRETYEATTKLLKIDVQIGKTGTITPVAFLEPVDIAETTVSRASLHNADEIERLDVREGDTVVLAKAGKIIPKVVRVEKHLRTIELPRFPFPTICPACQRPLERDPGGVYVRCLNWACPAQIRERLAYFASRPAMDIDGLGEKIIDQLVAKQMVQDYGDLYQLSADDLIQNLDLVKEKKAANLLGSLQQSKSRGLSRVLTAISIRHVGPRVARTLTQKFTSLETLRQATEEQLAAIDEVGPVIAKSVHQFIHSDRGRETFEGLQRAGLLLSETVAESHEPDPTANRLAGKTLVVTGVLSQYTRDEISEVILQHGGRVSSSVSNKTDYLVCGEKAGSKRSKAEQLGVHVLSEQDFLKLLSVKTNDQEIEISDGLH